MCGFGGDNVMCGFGGDDVVRGYDGNDELKGNDGNDVLYGNGGDDVVLRGGGGNDVLKGGTGDDVLKGGNRDDTLRAGGGADVSNGGGGADVFVFGSASHSSADGQHDTISEFSTSQMDIIDVSGIDAHADSGNQAFDFVGANSFSGTMGELRTVTVGSDIHVEADINGDGQAHFMLVVADVNALTASNFVL